MRRFLWSLLLLAAGCAAPPRDEVPRGLPRPPPAAAPAPAAPAESWTVVGSRLEVRVYRDGPMQRLGHNHVIISDALRGSIDLREPLTESRFDVALPLESLVVDDEAARRRAGADFAGPVPQKDRDATRRNMLGDHLLDAARQGEMRLTAESIAGTPGDYEARVRVSIAGEEHVVAAPFSVEIEAGRLTAHAGLRMTHAEIGLVPFTVALGALRVRDDFEVDLTLEARRGT